MLQIGSCCNNHLIINVIFKRLGVKAGKDSLPFAIFVTQNKENELLLSAKIFEGEHKIRVDSICRSQP